MTDTTSPAGGAGDAGGGGTGRRRRERQQALEKAGAQVPQFDSRPGKCAECGTGYEQQYIFGSWVPERCGACIQKAEAEAAAQRQREAAQRMLAERMKALHVPRLFARATLDDFDPTVLGEADEKTRRLLALKVVMARRFIEVYPEREGNDAFPYVVVFRGSVGTGKTMVAWCIVKECVQRYACTAVVSTLADIVRDVRESWGRNAEGPSERARLKKYREADLLVIDEVSRHALFGEPSQHLYDLIAPREADLKPTIITTNETRGSFAELVGPALESRVAGSGGLWNFGDLDYRAVRAEKMGQFVSDEE